MVEQTETEPTDVLQEDEVGAFEIKAASDKGVDYDKLIDKYGCFKISDEQTARIEKITGEKPHIFLRRNIFFCQRDLNVILDSYEQKKPFYLYTGRGPSSDALHMGHCVPFIFCQYLQRVFDVPIVIQITDDEKYIYRPELNLEGKNGTIEMGKANIKDIIAFGFDPEKTFIFSDIDYIKQLYPNIIRVQKHVNYNQIKGIFGFNESDNVGKFAFPPVQATPAFSNSFEHIFGKRTNVPCLIPAAIDQDPYFRMTRDIAQKLKYMKPASIYSTFFPALQGLKSKMSASEVTSAIFVTDKPDEIKKKINKYAFSGGQQTVEEHRKLGANIDVDVPFQWLTFFLDDDEKLEDIRVKYSSGEMLTGEVKNILIKCLQDFVKAFQERRKKVTNKDVEHFMSIRKINAVPKKWGDISGGAQVEKPAAGGKTTASSAPVAAGSMTLISDGIGDFNSAASKVTADICSVHMKEEQVPVSGDGRKKLSGPFPQLKVDGGICITGAAAITSFLARRSGQTELLGGNAFGQAQVEQFMAMTSAIIAPNVHNLEQVEYGNVQNQAVKTAALKEIKTACMQLNVSMGDRAWLVGDSMTVADIVVFSALIPAFQLSLDAGFRKATPALENWFERMSQLPVVTRQIGFIKVCGGRVTSAPAPSSGKKDAGKQANPAKPEKKADAPKAEEEEFDPFGEDDDEGVEDEQAKRLQKIADEVNKNKKPKKVVIAKSLVILEVKPWGPENDLDALGKRILKEVKMDGLVWKSEFKKEPVAFGVFKIIIGCVIEDDKVPMDDVTEAIEAFEDDVQSVDIAAFNKL